MSNLLWWSMSHSFLRETRKYADLAILKAVRSSTPKFYVGVPDAIQMQIAQPSKDTVDSTVSSTYNQAQLYSDILGKCCTSDRCNGYPHAAVLFVLAHLRSLLTCRRVPLRLVCLVWPWPASFSGMCAAHKRHRQASRADDPLDTVIVPHADFLYALANAGHGFEVIWLLATLRLVQLEACILPCVLWELLQTFVRIAKGPDRLHCANLSIRI